MAGAILLEKPLMLDGKPVVEGQVLIPVVTGYTAHAPTRKRPNFRLDISTAWSPEGCPSRSDVSWFTAGSGCRLKRIMVVLCFEEDTIQLVPGGMEERA